MSGDGDKCKNVRFPVLTIPNCKQGALRAVRYNVDGEYVLTCGSDRTIKLWNPEKSLLLSSYQGHSGDVLDVRGSCDNSQLASGSSDKSVFLWDVTTSRLSRRWRGHNSAVTAIQFNELSTLIISGSQDNTVKIWDVRAGRSSQKEIQSLDEAKDCITSIAITNHTILVGCADGFTRLDQASHLVSVADETVKLIDKDTGELLAEYKGHTDSKYRDYKIEVGFDFSDRYVLSASPFGSIFVWDLISESVKGLCKINEEEQTIKNPVTSLNPHPTRPRVVCSVGGGVYTFDLEEEGWNKRQIRSQQQSQLQQQQMSSGCKQELFVLRQNNP
ncbi:WD repeat domain-containing protein 83 [Orchesella cincta]|uniref:WD repeat domain-containing protein 83 n=1 Tax=Orchesella cincta TaxID=48709 RepID=A0A1D2MD13_ORCCI|nr:WD repeat domain-containing protein 83 [Orchesella cincta]